METPALFCRLLDRFPTFGGVSAEQLERLIAVSQLATVPAGSVLFDAHQPCKGFPLVLEGAVRVYRAAPNGREILLYRVEPGDGCILSSGCLLGETDHTATAVAESEVTLLNLPPDVFQRLIREHEPFRRFVFGLFGTRLAEIMNLVEEVAFRKLDQRLAQMLIRRGPVIEGTHQALADELGSVREIVSRLLRSFEVQGWVSLGRERIAVRDAKALSNLARA